MPDATVARTDEQPPQVEPVEQFLTAAERAERAGLLLVPGWLAAMEGLRPTEALFAAVEAERLEAAELLAACLDETRAA